jgi:hypothetical protein
VGRVKWWSEHMYTPLRLMRLEALPLSMIANCLDVDIAPQIELLSALEEVGSRLRHGGGRSLRWKNDRIRS